jgi:hypothetical protein
MRAILHRREGIDRSDSSAAPGALALEPLRARALAGANIEGAMIVCGFCK